MALSGITSGSLDTSSAKLGVPPTAAPVISTWTLSSSWSSSASSPSSWLGCARSGARCCSTAALARAAAHAASAAAAERLAILASNSACWCCRRTSSSSSRTSAHIASVSHARDLAVEAVWKTDRSMTLASGTVRINSQRLRSFSSRAFLSALAASSSALAFRMLSCIRAICRLCSLMASSRRTSSPASASSDSAPSLVAMGGKLPGLSSSGCWTAVSCLRISASCRAHSPRSANSPSRTRCISSTWFSISSSFSIHSRLAASVLWSSLASVAAMSTRGFRDAAEPLLLLSSRSRRRAASASSVLRFSTCNRNTNDPAVSL
mmetsp:Transcript_967/g.2410  ORF Transcript_967/g.2410 Transcript_967/m.2410 type:complete len:321 (-) Transcript_967:114-1076(-)